MRDTEKNRETNKAILSFIIEYIVIHGYAPSVREIGEGVGLSSSATVQKHLEYMIEIGELESDTFPRQPRAIRIPGYVLQRKKDRKTSS
uniref:LexA family protein n=1 Tax=Lachnoclostridium phocaeense TaxID=1871021 RepID=UPI0026DD23E4|nr:hypothetical protein [Lachnoclostridium phocaeense]